ncbi:MAG TPA: helix-turn-helix domain-containing protein [Geminicoccaceae bacterium]|nr:helix-turn-helix domain-containing protein [Geminicoccaceae bacterium]
MAVDEAEPRDLLVTAFELVADEGWSRLSLVAVARRAGVAPAEVYRELPSRGALLGALSRRIDEAMLEVEEADLVGLPPRDRVFELMMARLEALVPFRPGLARLARSARGDPCLVLATAWHLERSLAWLQDAAGLRSSGLRASLARRALGAAYLQALRVWFDDEAADLGRTMAELDKQLRRVQAFAGLRVPRASRATAGEPPAGDLNEGEAPLPA